MKMTAEEFIKKAREATPLTRQEAADKISDYYGVPRTKVEDVSEEQRAKIRKALQKPLVK